MSFRKIKLKKQLIFVIVLVSMLILGFILFLEEEVSSVDPNCKLIPETGPCRAYIPKYYFDNTTKTCQDFVWGGCEGSVPFDTLVECNNSCQK